MNSHRVQPLKELTDGVGVAGLLPQPEVAAALASVPGGDRPRHRPRLPQRLQDGRPRAQRLSPRHVRPLPQLGSALMPPSIEGHQGIVCKLSLIFVKTFLGIYLVYNQCSR